MEPTSAGLFWAKNSISGELKRQIGRRSAKSRQRPNSKFLSCLVLFRTLGIDPVLREDRTRMRGKVPLFSIPRFLSSFGAR
jgi:hypothetical protein